MVTIMKSQLQESLNKESCVLCRNFISIYIINRTFHGRLGIRILSSRAESISHSFASLTRERYFHTGDREFFFFSIFHFFIIFFLILYFSKRTEKIAQKNMNNILQ